MPATNDTCYWVGVIDPDTNGGYGFVVRAADVEAARAIATREVEPPYVVNGIRHNGPFNPPWLWSRDAR